MSSSHKKTSFSFILFINTIVERHSSGGQYPIKNTEIYRPLRNYWHKSLSGQSATKYKQIIGLFFYICQFTTKALVDYNKSTINKTERVKYMRDIRSSKNGGYAVVTALTSIGSIIATFVFVVIKSGAIIVCG
jgi:hypothetical protein